MLCPTHKPLYCLAVAGAVLLLGLSVACTQRTAPGDTGDASVLEGSIGKKNFRVKAKWQQILKLKDKKTVKSRSFHVSGNEWKIRWKTKPGKKGDDEFIIILYDKNNEASSEIIANVNGLDEDFSYLEGKGDYYLSVNTTQPYEVVVEESK